MPTPDIKKGQGESDLEDGASCAQCSLCQNEALRPFLLSSINPVDSILLHDVYLLKVLLCFSSSTQILYFTV
jgi:hypothetical protein